VKLIVLYRDDGRIVALSRVAEGERDDAGVPVPRSGVVAGAGQRVAVVELEPAWGDRSLASIHERCTVVREGDRIRLHERGGRASSSGAGAGAG
jgi:hypothetical protein